MNLKNSLIYLRLFSFWALAAIAFSCKRPDTDLGLELQPEDDLLNAYYTDTTTLWVSTVREDTLRTDELSSQMLGNYADPLFGQTLASIFTQLRLPGSAAQFPAAYTIDSVLLSLTYTGRTYGKLVPQSFEVYEMTEDIYPDSNYYSNDLPMTNMAENLIKPGCETYPVKPFDFTINEGDTAAPQLQLRLKETFGSKFFDTDAANFTDNDAFLEFFKGLHIRSSTTDAAVLNFDLSQNTSKLTIYYRDQTNPDEEDTTSYSFVMGDLAARFTHIEHGFDGTPLSGLTTASPLVNYVTSFVQAGASCKSKIELPFLENYNDWAGRTINKVQLIVPVEDQDNGRYPQPSSLFILGKTDEGGHIVLPDQVTANHEIGGTFLPDAMQYRFNITRWVQQVLNGEIENNGLFLVSNNAGVSVNRVELHGPQYDIAFPENNMRLLITFSN